MQLRLIGRADAVALRTLVGRHRSMARGLPRPENRRGTETWIERAAWESAAGQAYSFGVHTDEHGLVGTTRVGAIGNGEGQLSYWIARPFRRRGFATRAGRMVLQFAFETLRLTRVLTAIRRANRASQIAAARMGFAAAGTLENVQGVGPALVYQVTRERLPAGQGEDMITIRKEQIEAFQRNALRKLVPGLSQEIRDRYPHQAAGLDARIESALARGWRYDLRQDRQLRAFVKLAFCVGPNFDLHPPFRSILADKTVPPESRMDALFQSARPEDWEAAAEIAGA